jgi:hypothetical protein
VAPAAAASAPTNQPGRLAQPLPRGDPGGARRGASGGAAGAVGCIARSAQQVLMKPYQQAWQLAGVFQMEKSPAETGGNKGGEL